MEKIIDSPAENGEYLVHRDVLDAADGEKTVYGVMFRRKGIEEWEPVCSRDTVEGAEAYVMAEIERSKAPDVFNNRLKGGMTCSDMY